MTSNVKPADDAVPLQDEPERVVYTLVTPDTPRCEGFVTNIQVPKTELVPRYILRGTAVYRHLVGKHFIRDDRVTVHDFMTSASIACASGNLIGSTLIPLEVNND